ncbi:MAG: hypothetical protein M3O28_02320 [Actinomycetota bacterium]|nr:hypothetical protein [Actinomycetota bacterium]
MARRQTHAVSGISRKGRSGPLRSWSLTTKVISGIVGALCVGTASYAATSWIVGLNAGSNAEGRSSTVSNVTIAAIAAPSPSNLLYPGGTGDVVAQISNPNPFPVTVTAVNLPTNATYGAGYSNSALSTTVPGCDATTSTVGWNFSTASSGSTHTFTTPLTVGAGGTLTVTFTNDALMGAGSPAACENSFFSMPSLTGVAASGGQATATTSPATDAWTS